MRRGTTARGAAALAILLASMAVSGRAATITHVAGSGALGPVGLPQSQVFAPVEGPAGEVVYTSRLSGVFRRATVGVALVIGMGSAVPDGAVATVGATALDDAGCTVVAASLVGGGDAIYRLCADGTSRLVGTGDVTQGGQIVRRVELQTIAVAAGFVAFVARLDDGAEAVLRSDDAALIEIARIGSPSPTGGTLSGLTMSGVRTDGFVGLRAAVSGGRDGLFVGAGAGLQTAFVEGEATLVGRLDAIEQASLSPGGVWAFRGMLVDGRSGVFRFDGALPLPLVEAVLLTDDPIPTRPGTSVRDFPGSLLPSVNVAGDVAFRAVLGGTGSGAAIFATRGTSTASLVFSTRDETSEGLLARLSDPQLADDGSILFSATPVRGGTGIFVHRGSVVTPLASYGDPTDLGRSDLPFRFTSGRVAATAEAGLLVGEHDTLVRVSQDGGVEGLLGLGAPSPIGGEFAEVGPADIDTDGRVFFRAGIAGASRGAGIFAVTDLGVIDRATTNDRVRGGLLRDVVQTAVELGGDLSVAGRDVAFAGLVGAGGGSAGLYAAAGRRIRRLERTGKRRRGIGEVVAFAGRPALVSRRQYAFAGEVRDATTRTAVVARRRRQRRVVLREGASPDARLPGRIVGLTIPDASAEAIVFRATSDTGAAEAIFVDDWTAPAVRLASGEGDGRGGVVRHFERPVLAGDDVAVVAGVERGGGVGEALLRLPALVAEAPPEIVLQTDDVMPPGGRVHDILAVRGSTSGSILARLAMREGPERQILVRIVQTGNLDPLQASQ